MRRALLGIYCLIAAMNARARILGKFGSFNTGVLVMMSRTFAKSLSDNARARIRTASEIIAVVAVA